MRSTARHIAMREASRMFQRSISKASAAPIAEARARSRMRAASTARRSGSSSLLSSSPRMGRSGSKITAAANTGPNRAPRPASSRPAMAVQPARRKARSCRLVGMRKSGALAQTGGFAAQFAQVIQLGPADPPGSHHVYVVHHRRLQRKYALHSLAKAYLAHRDGLAHSGVMPRDHGSFEGLQPFLV